MLGGLLCAPGVGRRRSRQTRSRKGGFAKLRRRLAGAHRSQVDSLGERRNARDS